MVNSPGFPRLKGPTWSPSISRIRPSTYCLCKYKHNICHQFLTFTINDEHVKLKDIRAVQSEAYPATQPPAFSTIYIPQRKKVYRIMKRKCQRFIFKILISYCSLIKLFFLLPLINSNHSILKGFSYKRTLLHAVKVC